MIWYRYDYEPEFPMFSFMVILAAVGYAVYWIVSPTVPEAAPLVSAPECKVYKVTVADPSLIAILGETRTVEIKPCEVPEVLEAQEK